MQTGVIKQQVEKEIIATNIYIKLIAYVANPRPSSSKNFFRFCINAFSSSLSLPLHLGLKSQRDMDFKHFMGKF